MKYKQKIIIDTDPGHDDALALIMLIKSKLFNIQAITTVAGNCAIQEATNNAHYILDLLGENIPIYSGSQKPTKRKLTIAKVHGKDGLQGANIRNTAKLNGKAVSKIVEIVSQNPGEVSLVALGPLTNIAKAIEKNPHIASFIKQIVIMGGAISVPGNQTKYAEFNIFVDPEAAEIIFESNIKIVLVPLDACNRVKISLNDFQKLKASNLYSKLYPLIKSYQQGLRKFEKTNNIYLYDPLAAYYLINKNAYRVLPMKIKVNTSKQERGSLAEELTAFKRNNNVLLVNKIEGSTFKRDFFLKLFANDYIKEMASGYFPKELIP